VAAAVELNVYAKHTSLLGELIQERPGQRHDHHVRRRFFHTLRAQQLLEPAQMCDRLL